METENKKILLVEDDPNFGTVLKDYLAMNNYDVTHAKNGMEGFEKFKKGDFDLCILDVMMPYKDGFTLAKEIREKNKEVPIIFLTAKALKEDVLRGYKVGAIEEIKKNTRRFAKRQGTWFRKNEKINWFNYTTGASEIIQFIENELLVFEK